jgi:B12-binding domain/radical SAM domain protein
MDRINVLFRWSNNNHYTLSALIGLLDDKFDKKQFNIGTLEHITETPPLKQGTILAYSFMSPDSKKVFSEIGRFKSRYGSGLTVICGGPHASAEPETCLEAGADYVFTGEAEESLPDFLKGYMKSSKGPQERIIPPLPLGDFDSYPPFAYKRQFFGPIELRRGCANHCAFCQTPALYPKIRERSIEYVLKHAEYIRKAGRERVFFTISDALLYGARGCRVNTGKLEELLSGLKAMGMKTHLGNFPSEVSPDTLVSCPEAAGILAKYITNRKIIVGGQSGSEKVLRLMGRRHSVADISESVKILHSSGFGVIVDILLGIPGEKHEDRRRTLKLVKALAGKYSVKFNIHYFMPLPGSKLAGAAAEPVENSVKESIRRLIADGIAHGDFFSQLEYSLNNEQQEIRHRKCNESKEPRRRQ